MAEEKTILPIFAPFGMGAPCESPAISITVLLAILETPFEFRCACRPQRRGDSCRLYLKRSVFDKERGIGVLTHFEFMSTSQMRVRSGKRGLGAPRGGCGIGRTWPNFGKLLSGYRHSLLPLRYLLISGRAGGSGCLR